MFYGMYGQSQKFMELTGQLIKNSTSFYSQLRSLSDIFPPTENLETFSTVMDRLTKFYPKAPFEFEGFKIKGKKVKVEQNIVMDKPFGKLLHFKRDGASKLPPMLVFAPMSGHHASLLRRTVKTLLQDYDVYITDWVDPKFVPISEGRFGLDDYITYVIDFMNYFKEGAHILAVCQPTAPCLIASAHISKYKKTQKPRSLVLMGGPVDVQSNLSSLNIFTNNVPYSWFENLIRMVPLTYPGAFRRVYPAFLQLTGFISMHPDKHLQRQVQFQQALIEGNEDFAQKHRYFYDSYLSVSDMTEEFFLETIQRVFIDNCLVTDNIQYLGKCLSLKDIKDIPMLIIEGEFDDICPVGQTKAALNLCSNLPKKLKEYLMVPGVGHYGLFSSRVWEESTYFKMLDFTKKFD